MDFNEFAHRKKDCHVAENGFLIWKISSGKLFKPCELSCGESRMVVHILVEEGSFDVKFKDKIYHLVKNTYGHFISVPSVELLSVSDSVKAYLMACTDPYNAALLKNSPPMPLSLAEKAHKQPVNLLGPDEMSIFKYRMECLEKAGSNKTHIFCNEMIKCAIWMFLMDLSDIHIRKEANDRKCRPGGKKKYSSHS